jgi:hypothetical protein
MLESLFNALHLIFQNVKVCAPLMMFILQRVQVKLVESHQ